MFSFLLLQINNFCILDKFFLSTVLVKKGNSWQSIKLVCKVKNNTLQNLFKLSYKVIRTTWTDLIIKSFLLNWGIFADWNWHLFGLLWIGFCRFKSVFTHNTFRKSGKTTCLLMKKVHYNHHTKYPMQKRVFDEWNVSLLSKMEKGG